MYVRLSQGENKAVGTVVDKDTNMMENLKNGAWSLTSSQWTSDSMDWLSGKENVGKQGPTQGKNFVIHNISYEAMSPGATPETM